MPKMHPINFNDLKTMMKKDEEINLPIVFNKSM